MRSGVRPSAMTAGDYEARDIGRLELKSKEQSSYPPAKSMRKSSLATVCFLLISLLCAQKRTAHADEPPPPPPPAPIEKPTQASAGSVTLDDAVKRALARNPNAEIAREEIARAEALAKQVRATW